MEFKCFKDFMDYRFNDGGMMVCWNSAKFSIGSSLNIRGPKLGRINRLISDQMLQSNGIASYDKEKRYWLAGKAKQFLTTNGVAIIRDLLSLTSDEDAKAIGYANQMATERLLDSTLAELLANGELDADEWRLVTAMCYCLTGNVMSAVVMARYGGALAMLPQHISSYDNNGVNGAIKKRKLEQVR